MSKEQITYAGVSRLNGELKFRTATSKGRVIQLGRTDTDLKIVEISPVSSKSEAAKILLATDFESNDPEIVALLVAKAKDGNPFAKKAKKDRTVTIKATAKDSEGKLSPKEAAKIRAEFNAKVKEAYEAN